MDVRFRPRAEQDVEDAAQWYEAKLDGLGLRFIDEVDRVLGLNYRAPYGVPGDASRHAPRTRADIPVRGLLSGAQ